MNTRARAIGERSIAALRRDFLIGSHRRTEVARKLGVNRATVARRLTAHDMSLESFVAMAEAIGSSPTELLRQAEEDVNENPPT